MQTNFKKEKMKNLVKCIIVISLVAFSFNVNAQTKAKFGHIDSQELLDAMPGKDSAQIIMEKYQKELESQLEAMQKELETKYNQYMAEQDNITELIKKTKVQELQDLQSRIEQFQTDAQKQFKEKEESLLKPIVDQAKAAIEKVAKDNKYTYIFDSGIGVLLYKEDADDILPLVKKELGIE